MIHSSKIFRQVNSSNSRIFLNNSFNNNPMCSSIKLLINNLKCSSSKMFNSRMCNTNSLFRNNSNMLLLLSNLLFSNSNSLMCNSINSRMSLFNNRCHNSLMSYSNKLLTMPINNNNSQIMSSQMCNSIKLFNSNSLILPNQPFSQMFNSTKLFNSNNKILLNSSSTML